MLIVTGTALVLVTWAACLLALVVVGTGPALLTAPGRLTWREMRAGIWWGLLAVTVLAYLANLALPLGSPGAAALLIALVMVGAVAAAVVMRRRGRRLRWHRRRWALALTAALTLAGVYMAAAALGPVTNYDSGLYHLGAIRYAYEFPTIPGLANLYFPFGYGNAEFPLAALLGNGPWGVEGYRLLNGLLMVLVAADLVLRTGQRRLGPGFFVLCAGVAAAWVPMVALSDYWVTSPSQDSAVLFVTVACSAYLADAMRGARTWVADSGVAAALAIVLVLLRPTMAAFALAVLVVIVLRRWWRPPVGAPRFTAAAALVVAGGALAAVAATARDYLLSGWLQYPLSVLPFDVPWRAADPVNERVATLGFHRNPDDLWAAAQGWDWIGPWVGRLPGQWEAYLGALLILVAVAMVVVAARWGDGLRGWRAMVLAMLPSVLMVGVWWLATPPSFRFIWGPLFTCATIPIGWSLWALVEGKGSVRRSRAWLRLTIAAVAIPVVIVTAFSAAVRFEGSAVSAQRSWEFGVSIPYAVAPVTAVRTDSVPAAGGLDLRQPVESEQCWDAFPLCTPRPNDALGLRDGTLEGGFAPG